MSTLTAVLFAVTLLLAPAEAGPRSFLTPAEMRAEATYTGLPVEQLEFAVLPEEELNAYYAPLVGVIVFTGDWSKTPYELRLWVLYHELGHFKQLLESRPAEEWDADLYATTMMCQRGFDGPYWAYRVFAFLVGDGAWGAGDEAHGSAAGRVEHVKQAPGCDRAQYPLA